MAGVGVQKELTQKLKLSESDVNSVSIWKS